MAKLTRRNFVVGAACVAGTAGLPAFASKRPNLRVGVLSDIHVKRDHSAEIWRRALEFYRDRKVDAVLVTGDLVTWGHYNELADVARIWFEVFPDDRRPDGAHVERLFLTGNHDVDGFCYGGGQWPIKTVEEARRFGFWHNREKFWRELFHEDYAPVMAKKVNGYTFVLRNWVSIAGDEGRTLPLARGLANDPNPVPAWFAAHGAELDPSRPFFYCQHEHPRGTCSSPYADDSCDDGTSTRILSGYHNCIAFSGHSHLSLLEERTIWQGAFTSVGCSSTSGWQFTFALV